MARRGTKRVFVVRSAVRHSIRAASRRETGIRCVTDVTTSCTAQLVVGTPFWEKQAAEAWVSHRDRPDDRVLYGALYAVLMV